MVASTAMGSTSLGHKVYCKPTHYNLHLNSISHHHSSNKHAVLSTLAHRARALCDQDSLPVEMVLLRDIFRYNSYSDWRIFWALSPPPKVSQSDDKPDSVPFPLYVGPVFNHISRVLYQHNIKSDGLTLKKILRFLWSVKDNLGLKIPDTLRMRSGIYTAQTGHLTDTRLKEHHQHTCLEHLNKSVMSEHSINLGHCMQVHNTRILSTKPRYMIRIIREATKVEFHPNNMKSEDSICPSKSWTPPICSPEDLRKPPTQISRAAFSVGSHASRCVHAALIRAPTLPNHQPEASTLLPWLPSTTFPPYPPPHALDLYTQFLSHYTITTSPLLFPGPVQRQPFSNLAGYPGPISYWFAWLCGRANENWQVVLALLLVHSVPWASQWKLTVVLQFPLSSYINWNSWNPTALLATCSMLVSWLAYSIMKMERKFSSKTSVGFQQSTWLYITEDRASHNPGCENLNYSIPHKICMSAQLQTGWTLFFLFNNTVTHWTCSEQNSVM
jgi:hypothetical protein